MTDAPPFNSGSIISLQVCALFKLMNKSTAIPKCLLSYLLLFQLMYSKFEYDGKLNPTFKEGPFELPLSSIRAYIQEPITPRFEILVSCSLVTLLGNLFSKRAKNYRFVHVGSAGVTRPERPGLDLSKQPPAVRLNKELDFILTYKLKVCLNILSF